jgi:hypothetical protein
MSSRFFQLQTEAAYNTHPPRPSSSSTPHRSNRPHSARPHPQTTSSRTSTSSDSSTSSSSSSYSSSYDTMASRASLDSTPQPRVEVMRCSRCAKCVEIVVGVSRSNGELRRVSTDDASASGMVRFGHNLYYCERCARMVGYK